MRGEWIEITKALSYDEQIQSLPMRGEWIEIPAVGVAAEALRVSPHAGRVD